MPPTNRPQPAAGAVRPLVSVIIPTVDRGELLAAALGSVSVAAQQVVGQVEVIVVNDGGPSVASVVAAWDGKLPVTLIDLDQRSGSASVPRNAGIDAAAGEYLAFLDDDDLFLPAHLASGCQPLERGEADLVYLGAVVSDRRLDVLPPDMTGYPLKAYPYDRRFLMVANYLHTGAVIVRNFAHTPVRFDTALDVCEDWDLWIALTATLGYRVAYLDEITAIYHQVPDVAGLVSGAQLVSPSKFALARTYINTKWPSTDPLVVAYRQWMAALEQLRDDLIAQQHRMPNLLFDDVLAYLHRRISAHEPPDYSDLSRFFAADTAPVAGGPA